MSRARSLVALPRAQLLGRQHEREVLDRLLDGARRGDGGVLVVHGEPGVGKTALLAYAIEAAQEFRVARTAGVEGEMQLAYAALQQLCSPTLEIMESLPDHQRAPREPTRPPGTAARLDTGATCRRVRSTGGSTSVCPNRGKLRFAAGAAPA